MARFLSHLLAEETATGQPDTVILIGPKVSVDRVLLDRSLRELGTLTCPVFYLTYNPDPALNPWRDTIGSAVRFWKGSEYVITRPRDLPVAWADVMARLSDRTASHDTPGPSGMIKGVVPRK